MLRVLTAVLALALVAGWAQADEKEEKVAYAQVPEKVRKAFEKDFPGVKVESATKETYTDGTVHYEFEFKASDGKEKEVEYNVDGEKLDDHDDDDDDHKKDDKKATDAKKDEHKH